MPTDLLALAIVASRLLLAVVFAFAGLAKLANLTSSRQALAAFGVPASLVRPVGLALPAVELAVAGLLVASRTGWWGSVGALALLLVFIAAITVNLVRGRTPDCQCFGQVHAQPIGGVTLARNAVLAVCAGVNLWAGRSYATRSAVDWIAAETQMSPLALLLAFAAVLVLAAQAFLLLHLFRQHGRVLLRIDGVEKWLAMSGGGPRSVQPEMSPGPAIGTPAPSFTLPTPAGTPLGLEALLKGSRALLLIFSSPNCQPCTSLLPEISRWQRDMPEPLRVAVVSGGSAEANRAMTETHALRDVMIQTEREVAELYAVQGTPGAVLIRADGTIGSLIAMGAAAIGNLFATATASLAADASLAKREPSDGSVLR